MTEAGGPRALRVSDFDREPAVNHLKAHAAAGRISVEELGERVAGAARVRRAFAGLAQL